MDAQEAHCPAKGCDVRVLWYPVAPEDRDVARPSSLDLVCLDADARCTEPVCPLLGVAAERMRDRLTRFQDPRAWDRTE